MEILLLVTKQYPTGKGETYINHELEVLSGHFDRIVIIPIDCFDKQPIYRDLSHLKNVEVFLVNNFPTKLNFFQKIRFGLRTVGMICNEVIFGNDGLNHLKNFRYSWIYGYLCRVQSCSIISLIKRKGWEDERLYFYNYWMTRTTIASTYAVKELRKKNKYVLNISRAHSSDLYHKYWNDFIQLTPPPFMPFEYFKLRNSDWIYTISQHGLNHIARTFPQFAKKLAVSRLGVIDIQSELRPVRSERFEILTCANIHFNKGLHHMPEVLSFLKDLPVHWTHIGWGLSPSLEMVQEAIEKHRVHKMTTLLGHMNQDQIEQYYRDHAIDLIMNLSRAEGIPVSIMEAIRYGIPGIVTNAVGNPEIIDSSCGFVVPVDFQAKEVADLIRKMIGDKSLHEHLREGARLMYENRYHATKNFTEFCVSVKAKMIANAD